MVCLRIRYRAKLLLRSVFPYPHCLFKYPNRNNPLILQMTFIGYFYFVDRKGETFRWKGENCSTQGDYFLSFSFKLSRKNYISRKCTYIKALPLYSHTSRSYIIWILSGFRFLNNMFFLFRQIFFRRNA